MMVADVLSFCQICSAFKSVRSAMFTLFEAVDKRLPGVGGLGVVNSKKRIEYLFVFSRKSF